MLKTFLWLALALAACNGGHRSDHDHDGSGGPMWRKDTGVDVVPRTHTIPAGHAADVRKMFANGAMSYPVTVVSDKGANTQFVQPPPVFLGSDHFVLSAPPEFHDEIDRVLAALSKAPAAPSSTYDTTYWIIEADLATDEQVPPELEELASTLDALPGLGKRHFKSVDRVAARTVDGERSQVTGRIIKLDQSLSVGADGLRLKLELELRGTWVDQQDRGPRLETFLQLKPDVPAVLGDSSLATPSSVLLYVVRARRVD
jgi:hypothetical protein